MSAFLSFLFAATLWVQVPQWSDDWSNCAVDVPDTSCHWYIVNADNTFGEGFDWETAPWYSVEGLQDIANLTMMCQNLGINTLWKHSKMELIRPDDPQYFEQSSYEDYDRHHYKVVGKNGDTIVVEDYMSAQEIWWNRKVFLSHIEVLDKPKKESKGFK